MTLTADQYFQIAQGYAKAAADPFVPPESREAFGNKAEWFDFLARRERRALRSDASGCGHSDTNARRLAPSMNYSERPERSMSDATTRWLSGAALCLIAMLVLTDALNQFGGDNRPEVASNPKLASIDGKPTQEGGQPPTAARPHNLPGQPALEAAAFTVRPPLVQQEEYSAPSPPPEPINDPEKAQTVEVLKVAKNATLRAGPSTRAWKIGSAALGTALHVKARERNWVQFIDPSSGQIGWIHSSLVRPASSSSTAAVAASEEDLYEALTAPPLERLDRGYSLEEIRQSYDLRKRMRSVDLDTINFEFGSQAVAPEYYDTLEQLAEVINRILLHNPEEVFLIEAHSDAVGSEIDNLSLSDRRAEAVAIILTDAFGVQAENLVTQGYGEQFLKKPTELPERENRRVSVRPIKPLMSREYSSR